MEMDPATALELVTHGSTLLLLDAPLYTLIGIDTQEASYCEAVRKLEFDRHSGPYALNHYGEWKHLSNYITKRTIERIEPIGGEITVAREVGLVDTVPKTYTEKRLMEQL